MLSPKATPDSYRVHVSETPSASFSFPMSAGFIFLLVGFVASFCGLSRASGEEAEIYLKKIKPLLKERCYACHGALKQEGNLRLDTVQLMTLGGESGAAVVAAKPMESLLLQRVSAGEGERMPPEGKPLSEEEIASIRDWIAADAIGPADEEAEADPKSHWAFQLPQRHAIPQVDWSQSQNWIDSFVAAKWRQYGLVPADFASKEVLARRLSLDLTGLPLTTEEIEEVLHDPRPNATEILVDRLLASPAYGERWGRHWMDVWRYSDWYGRRNVPDVLNSYGQIWRWRDWIVESLNEDRSYAEMVAMMLAADELAPDSERDQVATGFLVRNFFRWNYHSWMKDNVEHTAKAFQGLSMNCCQCHDHKYDPISQEEYFAFRAFFEPIEIRHERVPGEPDPGRYPKYDYGAAYKPISSGAVRVYDENLDAKTFFYTGGETRNIVPDKPPVPPAAPAILGWQGVEIAPVELPKTIAYPGLKDFIVKDELASRDSRIQLAQKKLKQFLEEREKSIESATAELNAAKGAWELEGKTTTKPAASETALEGNASLLMHAAEGRRSLAYRLRNFPAIDDTTVVRYLVRINRVGHTNFQLGLNIDQGATGTFVGFENGTIKSYSPKTFNEFEIGKYSPEALPLDLQVELTLRPTEDTAFVSIVNRKTNEVFVNVVPVALNGWAPNGKDTQGFFFDARPGSIAAYDAITVVKKKEAAEETLLKIDFESPLYQEDEDVAEVENWSEPPYSAAPGYSVVSSLHEGAKEKSPTRKRMELAQANYRYWEDGERLLKLELSGATLEKEAYLARLNADRARYLGDDTEKAKWSELKLVARKLEIEAELAFALANSSSAEFEVLAAKRLPADTPDREQKIQALRAKLREAKSKYAAVMAAKPDMEKEYAPVTLVYNEKSTGRRRALAQFIANDRNPVTARIAVNYIWLNHFGKAIVDSTADFGRNGATPTHPELLDTLAVDLMARSWSMKDLHRRIVTSATYAISSDVPLSLKERNSATDQDNRFLWRYRARRLEAEVIRDSILFVSGDLDRTLGGKEIEHAEAMSTTRRSLYLSHHGEDRAEFLELFDAANPTECYRRVTSIRPQQALAIFNSSMTNAQAQRLVEDWGLPEWNRIDLGKDMAPEVKLNLFIVQLGWRLLSRALTESEQKLLVDYMNEVSVNDEEQLKKRMHGVVMALLSHGDFSTIR